MTKIVIVEDQQVLAMVYRNKFIAQGYEVEIASDGEQGLELINSVRPDLVTLDLMLPKINGIEVLRRVRANPLFQNLPVIIFSDASLPNMVEAAWKAGATMVLSKSNHSPNQIVESVRIALKAASPSQPSAAPGATTGPTAASPEVLISTQSLAITGHVLLVEDHPDICALVSFLLDKSGYEVTVVGNHAEALRQATAEQFDLYLINRLCPDGLGLALCSELRQSDPGHPIVMYSTAAPPTEQEAALAAGASAYLATPDDLMNIGKLLSDLMKESKTSAA